MKQHSSILRGNSLLHLLADLHRLVVDLRALVQALCRLCLTQLFCLLGQRRKGCQVHVGRQVPEKGGRDADGRTVGVGGLARSQDGLGFLVDDDLVVARLDETAGQVLELLAGLDEQMAAGGDGDGNAAARVAGPDVEARKARPAVDGQEVEVRVEAGQNGVEVAVLVEIGGRGGQKMGAVWSSVSRGAEGSSAWGRPKQDRAYP